MILILASELDAEARVAASHWRRGQATLLTPADLSIRGWCARLRHMEDAVLVASGQPVPAASVSGIVNLLPCIFEHELFDIEPADRRYVSAESTAFLLFLLTNMPCRVVNRPTPECLNGPYWRREQWSKACSSVGIRTRAVHRDSASFAMVNSESAALQSVTMLGGRCLGESSASLQGPVQQLSRLANVSFLKMNFIEENGDLVFHSAHLTPDISDEAVRAALHEYFTAS